MARRHSGIRLGGVCCLPRAAFHQLSITEISVSLSGKATLQVSEAESAKLFLQKTGKLFTGGTLPWPTVLASSR